MNEIIVHCYAGTLRQWPAAADAQLRRMAELWNTLRAIETEHRDTRRALIAESPEVAALDTERAVLTEEAERLIAQRKRARRLARRGDPLGIEAKIAARLVAIGARRKAISAERKDAVARSAAERMDRLKALDDARKSARKQARQDASHDGLWWGNNAETFQRLDTALKHIAWLRKQMRPGDPEPELREKRVRGHAGTLACQTHQQHRDGSPHGGPYPVDLFCRHGGAGWDTNPSPEPGRRWAPPRPPESPDREPMAWLRPYADASGKPRALVGMTVDVEGAGRGAIQQQVVVDVAYHRPLPDGHGVVGVRITRAPDDTRGARMSVSITCKSADAVPARPSGGLTVGVNVGWRVVPEGLRVATAAWSDGTIEHLVIPRAVLDRLDVVDEWKGHRDCATDRIWAALLERAEAFAAAPEALAAAWAEEMRRQAASHKRTHKGLFRLLRAWPADWAVDLRRGLTYWADRRDGRGLSGEPGIHGGAVSRLARQSERIAQHARELRRVWVANLVRRAARVVVHPMDMRGMTARADRDGIESELVTAQRRNAMIAAPGELLAWLRQQCQRAGTVVEECPEPISFVCHITGVRVAVAQPERLEFYCPPCGRQHDQDDNAALNALRWQPAAPARAAE